MKLKFTQSVAINGVGVMGVDDEKDIKDKEQAQSLIDAGFAVEVDQTPSTKKAPKKVSDKKDE